MKRAALFGAAMGIYSIASVFLIVSLLPPAFGVAIPIGGLGIAIAAMWPSWFDRDAQSGAGRRILRRLGFVGASAPVGAVASFLVVLAFPSFLTWSDNQHRQALLRQGLPPAEIEAQLAQHRQSASHFLIDGAFFTAMPGVIAALVTTGAGAILLRRRPTRP